MNHSYVPLLGRLLMNANEEILHRNILGLLLILFTIRRFPAFENEMVLEKLKVSVLSNNLEIRIAGFTLEDRIYTYQASFDCSSFKL